MSTSDDTPVSLGHALADVRSPATSVQVPGVTCMGAAIRVCAIVACVLAAFVTAVANTRYIDRVTLLAPPPAENDIAYVAFMVAFCVFTFAAIGTVIIGTAMYRVFMAHRTGTLPLIAADVAKLALVWWMGWFSIALYVVVSMLTMSDEARHVWQFLRALDNVVAVPVTPVST